MATMISPAGQEACRLIHKANKRRQQPETFAGSSESIEYEQQRYQAQPAKMKHPRPEGVAAECDSCHGNQCRFPTVCTPAQ